MITKIRNIWMRRYWRLRGAKVYGDGSNLDIHETVSFGGEVVLFGTEKIKIGENTLIGLNTILHTSTHQTNATTYKQVRIDRPIKIGTNVWIGTNATILPGVIIENNAIIAAGSVVTKNVTEGSIVGGNPAKILRINDDDKVEYKNQVLKKGFLTKWM